MKKKTIFVVSGPSGAGKSTIISKILSNNIKGTVSCTTRPKRDSETHGKDYYFIDNQKFDTLIQNGEFLEHVEYCGNKYGTLQSEIDIVLNNNDACILDIEFDGALNILNNDIFKQHNKIGILILPPSIKSLEQRLIARKSETSETLQKRLSAAFSPKTIANYEHVIINKDLTESEARMQQILQSYL